MWKVMADTGHTPTYLVDDGRHAGDLLQAQFAHCRVGVVDPVPEEN